MATITGSHSGRYNRKSFAATTPHCTKEHNGVYDHHALNRNILMAALLHLKRILEIIIPHVKQDTYFNTHGNICVIADFRIQLDVPHFRPFPLSKIRKETNQE